MPKIAIFGASGHGKVVAELAEECGFEVTFYDDAYPQKKMVEHWHIKGDFKDLVLVKSNYNCAIVAIGNNKVREKLSQSLLEEGIKLATLIHPKSVVSKYAKISSGTVVFANAAINAFAKIGPYCIINTGAIVEHDCIIGRSVHLSPNVALGGGTIINDLAWLGIGVVTCHLIDVGKNSIVGANSAVIKNIPQDAIAVGSPSVIKGFM